MPYEGDSFFTLSIAARWGLAGLSILLSGLILALSHWLGRGRSVAVRLGVAGVLFFAFVWLSPQVYYAYYRMIIDGLPAQLVVKGPPGPLDLLRQLGFVAAATLSDHGKGVLGWVLFAMAAMGPGRRRADPPSP